MYVSYECGLRVVCCVLQDQTHTRTPMYMVERELHTFANEVLSAERTGGRSAAAGALLVLWGLWPIGAEERMGLVFRLEHGLLAMHYYRRNNIVYYCQNNKLPSVGHYTCLNVIFSEV